MEAGLSRRTGGRMKVITFLNAGGAVLEEQVVGADALSSGSVPAELGLARIAYLVGSARGAEGAASNTVERVNIGVVVEVAVRADRAHWNGRALLAADGALVAGSVCGVLVIIRWAHLRTG